LQELERSDGHQGLLVAPVVVLIIMMTTVLAGNATTRGFGSIDQRRIGKALFALLAALAVCEVGGIGSNLRGRSWWRPVQLEPDNRRRGIRGPTEGTGPQKRHLQQQEHNEARREGLDQPPKRDTRMQSQRLGDDR
jgi:hypothetical protein